MGRYSYSRSPYSSSSRLTTTLIGFILLGAIGLAALPSFYVTNTHSIDTVRRINFNKQSNQALISQEQDK